MNGVDVYVVFDLFVNAYCNNVKYMHTDMCIDINVTTHNYGVHCMYNTNNGTNKHICNTIINCIAHAGVYIITITSF